MQLLRQMVVLVWVWMPASLRTRTDWLVFAKAPGCRTIASWILAVGPSRLTCAESSPEAYERLILDVLLGDPPLFPQHEEVELSWRILDPITTFWAEQGDPEPYLAGTWGPASADVMMARDGRSWRLP